MHEQTAALSEVESEELMGERGIFKQPCQCFPFELNESKAAGPVDGLSSLTMLQNHIFTSAFLQKLSRSRSLFFSRKLSSQPFRTGNKNVYILVKRAIRTSN